MHAQSEGLALPLQNTTRSNKKVSNHAWRPTATINPGITLPQNCDLSVTIHRPLLRYGPCLTANISQLIYSLTVAELPSLFVGEQMHTDDGWNLAGTFIWLSFDNTAGLGFMACFSLTLSCGALVAGCGYCST